MATNPTQQAYDNWQAAKTPWYRQATPTSLAKEREAEQAYTNALRNPQSPVKFGGQPGAGLAARVAEPTTAEATAVPKPATTPLAGATSATGAGRGTVNPPSVNPLLEAARQVAPGIFRSGNSYASTGDAAVSLDREPKGPPSAQNMAAADQLAANQQMDSISRVATSGNVPQSPAQGLIGRITATHSGNDWTAREMLRRQKMDANSLIHQSHWAKKGSGQAAQKAYGEALQADYAAMTGGQTDADVDVMKQNAGLQREGMQQDGEDRRDARRSLIDAARLGQDGQRLSMERETQQIQNRPRSLIASLQEQIAAEQDSTRRDSLVQRMRDIEGKGADVDPYLVVPGGQQTNSEGQVYTAPSSVFNRRSGTYLQQPGTAPSPIGSNPQAAAIRANTSMTREQKVEALRKLGYS